LMIIVLIFIS